MSTMQFEYDPERLIEEVKKRPGIWDFEDADYRAKNVRYQLWNEVVKELLTTDTDDVKVTKSEMRILEIQLQKKWKSIRDCFHKYNQNPNRTRRPYIYKKQLQFLLKNQITRNEGEGSSDSEDGGKRNRAWKPKRKLQLKKDEESSEEDNNMISDNESREYLEDFEEPTPSKVRKMSKPAAEEFAFANVEAKPDILDDPDRMFLLSLLPHFKSIPEEMRINVKMDLMQVLKVANFGYTNSAEEKFRFKD